MYEQRAEFLKEFIAGVQEIHDENLLSDITLEVEGKRFQCHKLVLSALSPYFKAMFTSNMKESRKKIITLPFVNVTTFELVYEYLYSGNNNVSVDDVEAAFQLLEAAHFMQMEILQKSCEKRLNGNIKAKNCVKMWLLGRKHASTEIEKKGLSVIMKNFTEGDMIVGSQLIDLGYEDFKSIFDKADLKTVSEDFITEMILKWLEHDFVNRKKHSKELYSLLKLPFASSEYLYQLSGDHQDIVADSDFMPLLDEARKFQAFPAIQTEFSSPSTLRRLKSNIVDVLIVIGGCESDFSGTTRNVSALCNSKWYALSPLPREKGSGYAVCTYGTSTIYLTGGMKDPRSSWKYDGVTNRWLMIQQLPVVDNKIRLYNHTMIALGQSVYVLSGHLWDEKNEKITTVFRYAIESNSWFQAGNLSVAVTKSSASVSRGKIYLFGGIDKQGNVSTCVQCYDPKTCTAAEVFHMPVLDSRAWSFGFDDDIMVISATGKVLKVKLNQPNCVIVGQIKEGIADRNGFGIAKKGGILYIVGGTDKGNSSVVKDCMLKVCPVRGVLDRDKLPFKLYNLSALRLSISSSILTTLSVLNVSSTQ